jgi:hypothetical protein
MKTAMEQFVPLGFGGVEAPVGAHICAFYHGRAGRDELMIPFLQEGIRNGEKCIAIVDTSPPEQIWTSLNLPKDVDGIKKNGQVEVLLAEATYIREGHFDIDRMIDFWTECACGYAAEGFDRIRASGETEWANRGVPGTDALFYYESRINNFTAQFPNIFLLCLYDLDSISGRWVIDAMKTHPQVLIGGRLFQNPYYMDPDTLAKDWSPEQGTTPSRQGLAFPPL